MNIVEWNVDGFKLNEPTLVDDKFASVLKIDAACGKVFYVLDSLY